MAEDTYFEQVRSEGMRAWLRQQQTPEVRHYRPTRGVKEPVGLPPAHPLLHRWRNITNTPTEVYSFYRPS